MRPDISPVMQVYGKNSCLVDRMKRFEQQDLWSIFSNEFVLEVKSEDKVGTFVQSVYQAKLDVERKMKRELD